MNRRPILAILASVLVWLPAHGPALGQDAGGEPDKKALESTRTALAKWVETQEVISKERKDWQEGKELLEQRISLVQGQIDDVEQRIAAARKGLADADGSRRELGAESRSLDDGTAVLEGAIAELETKAGRLVAMLPGPIRSRVAPLSQRLPSGSARSGLTLGERYQNVIGILNEVNKFNADITVASEIRPLPDGTTAEVQALYIGLGQAYYVTANGNAAGIGRPSPEGWTWTPADDLAGRIREAIAILQNEKVPAYVPLPVTIQ